MRLATAKPTTRTAMATVSANGLATRIQGLRRSGLPELRVFIVVPSEGQWTGRNPNSIVSVTQRSALCSRTPPTHAAAGGTTDFPSLPARHTACG